MIVKEKNEPSDEAIRNSIKILLEIIKNNKLDEKYLPKDIKAS